MPITPDEISIQQYEYVRPITIDELNELDLIPADVLNIPDDEPVVVFDDEIPDVEENEEEVVDIKPVDTVNLRQLAMLFNSAANCGNRNCDSCKKLFETGRNCPLWINKENSLAALKAIEKYLDDEYDKAEEIRSQKLIQILQGES